MAHKKFIENLQIVDILGALIRVPFGSKSKKASFAAKQIEIDGVNAGDWVITVEKTGPAKAPGAIWDKAGKPETESR